MSGSKIGKKKKQEKNRTKNMCAGIYHFPIHSNSFNINIQLHM